MKSKIPFAWEQRSEGVFFATSPTRWISRSHIDFLKAVAAKTPLGRARVCLHADEADAVQEMIIAMSRSTVVSPHYHAVRQESYHAIEGLARLVLFSDAGRIVESILLGGLAEVGDSVLCCRIPVNVVHTLVPETDFFVFQETAAGPFEEGTSIVPPWVETPADQRRTPTTERDR